MYCICVLELCRCILRWQLGMFGVHLGVRRMGLNDFQYNMYMIYLLERYDYNIIIFTYNAFCEPSA